MDYNRVTACKALLDSGYDPTARNKSPLQQAALAHLSSLDMLPWGRGVEIETDMWGNAKGGLNEHTIQPWMQDKVFVLVNDIGLLKDLVTEAIKTGLCVVDIETQGLDNRVYDGKPVHGIVGIALCFDGEVGYYIPARHISAHDDISNAENGNLPWEIVKEQVQRILDECVIIYHNATFDVETLWAEGFEVPEAAGKFEDTQVAGWLIDSNLKRISLKAMSKDQLDMVMINFKQLFPEDAKDLRFEDLHPEESYIYAASDGICTWLLWDKYKDNTILLAQKFIYKVEKMLVAVLRRMQRHKILIDVEYLRKLDADLETQCAQFVEDIHRLCGNNTFSIDSAKQLGEVLFDQLLIPNSGLTASEKQWKTDRQTLEDLDKKYKGKYPALTMVVKYRQLMKLRGTYLGNLINNVDRNNEARFGIKACGAPTGRFAAPGGDPSQGFSGVNSQAIPKVKKGKPNIRKAFVARPGFVIVAIDFAGVELRIAGNLSGEGKWINEFNHLDCIKKYENDHEVVDWSILWHHCPYCRKKMGDIHSQTAMDVFGSAEEKYRNQSKGVNFGILYGAGGRTIAANVGVSDDEGFRIVKTFKDALPGINSWIKRQHRAAKKNLMVKTAFGRVRLVPEMLSEDQRIRSFGERTAVNTVVQGASADITKIAMVGCDKVIRKRGWVEHCRLLLTVHDEIVFEVRDTMLDEILPVLGITMSKCQPKGWKIPLTVDIEYGDSWGTVGIAWKPPAPRVIPRRPEVAPLWDDEDLEVSPAQVSRPAPEISTPKVTKPAPESGSSETVATEASPEPAPTPQVEQAPQQVPVQIPQPLSGVDTYFEYTLKRPYTRIKWRKLEALFILAGEGTTQLRLNSESGQNLLGGRKVLVDPLYFGYKAEEWGL